MSETTRFAEGPFDAQIAFIGEAPSFEEIRREQPFVGPAGALFERCLHAAGLIRARVRILNTFEDPVHKKRDDEGKLFNRDGDLLWTKTKGFTEAGRAASSGCLARLAACSANVIVTMGAPALSLCVDSRSITKWRGSIIEGNAAVSHRKVIPAFHPAYALRGAYEARYQIISDFKKAKAQSSFPEVRPPQRAIIIDPSFEQATAYLRLCATKPAFATDIELLSSQVSCFSLAFDPSEAISIPLIDADFNSRWSVDEEIEIWRLYAELISNPAIIKINQNISFDLAVLLQLNNIIPQGRVEDPMVAHSIMHPGSGEAGLMSSKKLGVICSLYTDEPYYKDDGSLQDSASVEDFTRYWTYNAKDAAIALESWLKLAPMIDSEGYRATYDITVAMIPALVFMTVHGMRLNETALLATRDKAKIALAKIVADLQTALGRPVITEAPKKAADKRAVAASGAININSPKQLCGYFYGEKKLKPYLNPMGVQSIDDKALARIARRDGLPEAKLLQDYRSAAKLLSTYLEVGYDTDMRLRCSYNIRGTWTGRLSSSQTVFGSGLNQQNLPPEMRGFLESDMAA